ncbi:hypothetical protein ACFOUV_09395 [Oceanobacillus longus]|uniref:Uncharacterized protein n=1 Tax=Oceanobacillus longus TaxID=930120 RepID=A0ABV8GZI4_9BACI
MVVESFRPGVMERLGIGHYGANVSNIKPENGN